MGIDTPKQASMGDYKALADYFQKEADRARNPERKAHYQRCAEEHRANAKEAERAREKPISDKAAAR